MEYAVRPFKRLKSGQEYNAGYLDKQFINVEQSIGPTLIQRVKGAYRVTVADRWISGDTTTGNFAVTLPADPTTVAGMYVTITNVGTGTLTVTGTVSGAVNPTLTQWHSMTVMSDGIRYVKTGSV